MASTAPAKSQPLHNFDLPHLKWKKDGTSSGNHQRRRSVNSPSRRPNLSPLRNSPLRDSVSAATSPYRQSPLRDTPPPPPYTDYPVRQSPIRVEWSRQSPIGWAAASESETSKGSVIGYRKKRNPNPNPNPNPNGEVNSSKKSKLLEVDSAGIKRSSKIKIKIPGNKGKSKPEEEENQHDEDAAVKAADRSDEGDEVEEVQEEGKNNNNNTSVDEEAKTWNLRPRKPMSSKKSLVIGGLMKNSVSATAIPESSSSRNLNHKTGENEGNGDKEQEKEQEKEKEKEKRKLSINIALTKEEIEEDFFGWTGAKPPRRPKKRPKNIQKQLDFVFPGLWLVSITPDSYKVSENYMKG